AAEVNIPSCQRIALERARQNASEVDHCSNRVVLKKCRYLTLQSEIARSDILCFILTQINCQDLPSCLCQEATYFASDVPGGARDKDHRFVLAWIPGDILGHVPADVTR